MSWGVTVNHESPSRSTFWATVETQYGRLFTSEPTLYVKINAYNQQMKTQHSIFIDLYLPKNTVSISLPFHANRSLLNVAHWAFNNDIDI